MLDFFRRYQRYFFLVITVVIIISFSFFGTYSTLGSNTWREQIAFKDVKGHEVTRADVDEMALFLATDNQDKILFGGAWGPNFLNDGVIQKDFLETGLAEDLALAYRADLQTDIDKRLAKEKKYTLYRHPQAPFLGVENVWNYFAPQMNIHYGALKVAQNGLDPHAFKSRVQLYLGEKQIPASTLRYVLRSQEKQYNWLPQDEKLNQTDLSLFGYHTLEDWFGPHFTRLVSEFIINASQLAEAQGYDVSKAEVLSDLVRSTQSSYQQNLNNPNLGVTSADEYLNEQLRRLNMDQARAVKIWRQVLLFRRYFHDAGATALVDNLASQNLHQFANENITLDLYRIPSSLQLASSDDLQKFEIYLQAVAKTNKQEPLALPDQFLSAAEVAKVNPELVQKHYKLSVAQTNQKKLQARIGLRDLWNWEVEDPNWQLLVKQFPALGAKESKTREGRFEALDALDATTRTAVNAFAKQSIVKSHPEWIEEALSAAEPKEMNIGLRTQGGKMPFNGLDSKEERQAFIRLLDQAVLGEAPASTAPLYAFSGDDQTYYRIKVISRESEPEILTFAEARVDGTLDEVRDRQLEKYYLTIREQSPLLYQKENKEWQPYKAVKDLVGNQYFEKVFAALDEMHKKTFPDQNKKAVGKEKAASLRFYTHLNKIKENLENGSPQSDQWIVVKEEDEEEEGEKPKKSSALADQWKIEKKTVTFNRQSGEESVNVADAFELKPNAWSSLETPANGDLAFYQVKAQGASEADPAEIAEQTREAQFILGAEAQRHLMRQVLQELKAKNAISLAYLKIPNDEREPQQQETID